MILTDVKDIYKFVVAMFFCVFCVLSMYYRDHSLMSAAPCE